MRLPCVGIDGNIHDRARANTPPFRSKKRVAVSVGYIRWARRDQPSKLKAARPGPRAGDNQMDHASSLRITCSFQL